MDPILGEIRMFGGDYEPHYWKQCDGQLLKIDDYGALYSLIGTRYGGDGEATFGLPDFRGAVPTSFGDSVALGAVSASIAKGDDGPKTVAVNFIIAVEGLYPERP